VRLPGADVSAAHARLRWTDGELRVEDLGSVNGTRIGARALIPGRTFPLAWDEPLQIADYQITVLNPASPAPAPFTGEAGTATLAAHLVRDMAGDRDAARLRVRDPTGHERVVPLAPGARLRLGRDPGCEVQLADPDLSREHAEICMASAGATLRDLGSKNGVTVNDVDWTGSSPGALHHGDVIRLGGTMAWFEDPAEALLRAFNQSDDADAPGIRPADPPGPRPAPGPDPGTGSGLVAAPPPPTVTPSPAPPSRPQASPGRLGRTLLIGLGVTLMGAAVYLLLWLFT